MINNNTFEDQDYADTGALAQAMGVLYPDLATSTTTPATSALTQAATTPATTGTEVTKDTPGARPIYGGRNSETLMGYEVPAAYTQAIAAAAAAPSYDQIYAKAAELSSKIGTTMDYVYPMRTVHGGAQEEDKSAKPIGYKYDNGNAQYVMLDLNGNQTGVQNRGHGVFSQIQDMASTMSPIILGALSGGILGAEGVLAGQVISAGQAIQSGNVLGGLAQLAGAGGYTDVATGLNAAQALSTGSVGSLVTALVNNPSVAAVAGTTMLTDTISLADAANATRAIAAATSGSLPGVLSSASALTGSADLATAAAAASLITAANTAARTGSLAGVLSAATGLQGALTAANNVTNASVASTLVKNVGDFAAAAQDTSTTITNPNVITSGGSDSGYSAYQAAINAGATPDEALAASNAVTRGISTVTGGAGNDTVSGGAVTDAQAQAAITASRGVFEGDNYNTRADAANAARLAGSNTFSYDGKTYGIDTWESDGRAAVSNVLDSVRQDQLSSIATIPKFADAYTAARALLGPGQTFTWNGKPYSTATRAEDPVLAAASDKARMDNLSISTTVGGGRGTTQWTAADTLGAVAASVNLNKVSAAAVDWSSADDMFGGASTDAMGNAVNTAGSGANTALSRMVTAAQDALGKAVQTGLSNLAMAGGEQTAAIGGVLANLKLASPDNILVQAGNAVSNFGSSIETEESKKGTQNIVSAVSKADGVLGKLIAGVSAGWDNPSAAINLITREGLQEILPIGIASKAAKIMSIGAAAGIDTAINAGEAMGGAYNDAYKAAIKAGMSAENADAFAGKVGLSAGGIALVTSGVMDAALVKTLFRTETGSIASQLAKGSTKEGISENIEETATALATQYLTTGKMDFNSALTQGAIGHLIGKTTSGSVGSIDTGVQLGDASATVAGATGAGTGNVVTGAGTGNAVTGASTGNVVTGGASNTTAGAGTEVTAEAIGGAGKIDDDSNVATADDFSTILSSTGDASTAATTAVTNAVGSGADPGSAVAAVITAAADTGANATAATGAAVTAAVNTAANTAASTGANASTAVTAATNSAVTAAVSTAATTATATGANTNNAVTSATDAAVTSAVTAAANSGADVNTAATTAVTAAVTAAVNSGVDANTAATTAVTAAVNSGVDANTATTAATNAATTANTNVTTGTNTNIGVTTNTAVDANTAATTNTAVDANTGVTTTTSTNPNTDVTTTTTTNPNTSVTTNTTTDTNTNTTTNTVTNPDTNSTITLTLNTQTGVPTVTDSVGDVQVVTNDVVVIDGTPIDIITGETLTPDEVKDRIEKSKVTTPKVTSPKIVVPKTPTKKSSSPMQGYGANEPMYSAKDHDIEETWLGGTNPTNNPTSALAALFAGNATMNPDMQAYSALRDATGGNSSAPVPTSDYYSYGTEPTPSSVLQPYMRGGTVQNRAEGGKMMASPLMAASSGEPYHKGSHYVQGAGGGQDDLIPAKLADGEYVFDAEIVAALGDGSNKEGAAKLDKWREAIRKHKRSGSINSIPPKAKSPLAYMKGI